MSTVFLGFFGMKCLASLLNPLDRMLVNKRLPPGTTKIINGAYEVIALAVITLYSCVSATPPTCSSVLWSWPPCSLLILV